MPVDPNVLDRALNRLAKWRGLFAGWQLGTRPADDPECQAVRDHREVTILLRAEVSALTAALERLHPGFVEIFREELLKETGLLQQDYERKFPGATATDSGISYDNRAVAWMKKWRP